MINDSLNKINKKPLIDEGFVLLFTPSKTYFTKSYFRDEITDLFHILFYLFNQPSTIPLLISEKFVSKIPTIKMIKIGFHCFLI